MPGSMGTGQVCPRVGAPGKVPGSECWCGMDSVCVGGRRGLL